MQKAVKQTRAKNQRPTAQNSEGNSGSTVRDVPPQLERNQWKPGQSGNPGGRPRKTPVTDALIVLLDTVVPGRRDGLTYAAAIAQILVKEACKGKLGAIQEISDRVEGKVIQGLQHSGPQGGAIPLTSMTPEENERRIAELLTKAGGFYESEARNGE